MHFYALRISCGACHRAFIAGGCRKSDLASWRERFVECCHCGTRVLAATGVAVDLGGRHADVAGKFQRDAGSAAAVSSERRNCAVLPTC
jgi:hypothetical protein